MEGAKGNFVIFHVGLVTTPSSPFWGNTQARQRIAGTRRWRALFVRPNLQLNLRMTRNFDMTRNSGGLEVGGKSGLVCVWIPGCLGGGATELCAQHLFWIQCRGSLLA